MKEKTIIGVEYYRPPNPKVKDFSADLQKIKKAGLSVIRIWYHWQQVNPEEGKWDFSNYDKLFESAGKNGIGVLLQINIEVPPEWLIRKYPDGKWINSEGKPVVPKSVPMAQVGTYPGLTPDYPPVKKHIEDFLGRTIEHYREHPALYGWDVWNEIMPFYGVKSVHNYLYHPETKLKFQQWLKKRHKDIRELNRLYGGRNYRDFSDVPAPPEPPEGVTIELLDFYEFACDWILDYLKWKVDIVKRFDSQHPVVAHPGSGIEAVLSQPYDPCEMAAILDKWGASCYETYFWRAAFLAALTRDASQGKDWGFVEMAGSRTWWGPYGGYLRTPEFLEQLALLPLSYGGKFNLFWQWRPERFGQESPNFGLVNEDGTFNKRTEKVTGIAHTIVKNQKLFDELKFPVGDVGLLFDWRSIVLEVASQLPDPEQFVLFEYLGWFHSLSKAGANVEILYGNRVAKKGVPKNIKLIIAPLLNIEREGMSAALQKFVDSGGHFLAGPYLFTYDKFTYMHEQTPPEQMQKIFGGRRKELLFNYIKNINLLLIDAVPNVMLPGHHCLEIYECGKASPWLFAGKEIAGTKYSNSGAKFYRIGSLTGTPIGKALCFPEESEFTNNSDGLVRICRELLCDAGCNTQEIRSSGDVLLRIAESGNGKLLFVHNPEEKEQGVWLSFDFAADKITDLQGNKYTLNFPNRLYLDLKGRQTKVFRINR